MRLTEPLRAGEVAQVFVVVHPQDGHVFEPLIWELGQLVVAKVTEHKGRVGGRG